jgi:hypothetical protein
MGGRIAGLMDCRGDWNGDWNVNKGIDIVRLMGEREMETSGLDRSQLTG